MAVSISKAIPRLSLPLLLALSGCGWYTNVPAQIRVQNVEPATVGVAFSNNVGQFTNPTVTAIGEYGSIGVTYYKATITYHDSSSARSKIDALSNNTNINLRVEPSFLKTYPTSGQTTTQPSEFIAGSGKAVLPIVNEAVLSYATSTNPKPGTITAYVVLDGTDDAKFPAQLNFYVPITFAGN